MKYIYGVFCILGLLIPMSSLLPWFMEHGLDLLAFLKEIGASRLSAAAWADIILTSLVLMIFIVVEGGGRLRMKCIAPGVAATALIGPSFGLPLFLWLRERELERKKLANSAK